MPPPPHPVKGSKPGWTRSSVFGFNRRKFERVALLGSTGARRAVGYSDVEREAKRLLVAPLVRVLKAGLDDGSFPKATPVWDADTIHAIVWEVIEWRRERGRLLRVEEGLEHCLRFALASVGYSEP